MVVDQIRLAVQEQAASKVDIIKIWADDRGGRVFAFQSPWHWRRSKYLLRDNDAAYGSVFTRRLRAMGIRDRPIAPRSPWQNAYVERLIETIRRDCLDHILISGEAYLRRVLALYSLYYNQARTHLGLGKDAPLGASRRVLRDSYCRADPVRIASPVLTDMIFGRDNRASLGSAA